MHAYRKILKNILKHGKLNQYTKGNVLELINVDLEMSVKDWKEPTFYNRLIPEAKLRAELELYISGDTRIKSYNMHDIKWWDYASGADGRLHGTYPSYMKFIKKLKSKPSKNNVVGLWEPAHLQANLVMEYKIQQPCISQINLQIQNNCGSLIITQRSCDASLGGPADVFQMFLLLKKLCKIHKLAPDKLIFNFNNIHIYGNNIDETKKWLKAWNKCEKIKYNFKQN